MGVVRNGHVCFQRVGAWDENSKQMFDNFFSTDELIRRIERGISIVSAANHL